MTDRREARQLVRLVVETSKTIPASICHLDRSVYQGCVYGEENIERNGINMAVFWPYFGHLGGEFEDDTKPGVLLLWKDFSKFSNDPIGQCIGYCF